MEWDDSNSKCGVALEEIIKKHFGSLQIIDLRYMIIEKCQGDPENCFLKKIADLASPSNIKKISEKHSKALRESLVARKDMNIPYEIIRCIEIFTYGFLKDRGCDGDEGINERISVRYPKNNKMDRRYPIRITVHKSRRCEHVEDTCVFFT